MNWTRIVGYGLAVWAIPFVLSVLLFTVRQNDRALFESLITVIGVALAVVGSVLYFRDGSDPGWRPGLVLGCAWAAISILLDLPIFLAVFHMALPDYLADVALTYLAFPTITTGIGVAGEGAMRRGRQGSRP